MNCPLFVSVNAVVDAPVVEDGKVVVGKVMNVNFIVDHRYIDGGNAKTFMKSFRYVFDNPEKFLKSSDGEVMQK